MPTATATVTSTPAPTNTATLTATATPRLQTLRDYAEAIGFYIGVQIGAYASQFTQYERQLLEIQKQFNLGLLSFGIDGGFVARGKYSFNYTDYLVRLGTQFRMKMLGHILIWPKAIPDWLKKGNFSREEMLQIMEEWITTTMTRYPQVSVWEVVNEYSDTSPAQPYDIFLKTIGEDYILHAYRVARRANSSATLIYNDYDNHTTNGRRTQLTKRVVDKLRAENLLDGVGLQMHLQGSNPPSKSDVIETMRSYGLPTYVTEFDVNLINVSGTPSERFERQAEIYREMLEGALESGVCKNFIFFRVGDRVSPWRTDPGLPGYSPNADPTTFDDNFQPKPAYFAVLKVLQEYYAKQNPK
jgi:endo-1,4-beta-xylanase